MRLLRVAILAFSASIPVIMLGDTGMFIASHFSLSRLASRLPYLLEPLVFTVCTVFLGLTTYAWRRCLRAPSTEAFLLALLTTAVSAHIIVRVLYRLVLFTTLGAPLN